MSMKPGATIRPVASKISQFCKSRESLPGSATSSIFSPSSSTSRDASVFDAGSMTRPFLIRSMRKILFIGGAAIPRRVRFLRAGARVRGCGIAALFLRAGNQQEEQRHANRDAVCDLFEHAGLRAVGDFRRNFDAAIHRAGMQNERIRFCATETLSVELIAQHVILGGDGWLVHTLGLHAKHKNDVSIFESFV